MDGLWTDCGQSVDSIAILPETPITSPLVLKIDVVECCLKLMELYKAALISHFVVVGYPQVGPPASPSRRPRDARTDAGPHQNESDEDHHTRTAQRSKQTV
jgi:hypothetical protein